MIDLKHQIFLSLDTACGHGSVAVFVRGACASRVEDPAHGMQAKRLISMVEQALNESGVRYADMDAIVCTVGPGSFTGIRIALAAARAFGLAQGVPVVGVSTLACVAFQGIAQPRLAVLNAGKGEVYVQPFDAALEPRGAAHMLSAGQVRACYPGYHYIGQTSWIGGDTITLPHARAAGELLCAYPSHAMPPVPTYIRAPDATLPRSAAPAPMP